MPSFPTTSFVIEWPNFSVHMDLISPRICSRTDIDGGDPRVTMTSLAAALASASALAYAAAGTSAAVFAFAAALASPAAFTFAAAFASAAVLASAFVVWCSLHFRCCFLLLPFSSGVLPGYCLTADCISPSSMVGTAARAVKVTFYCPFSAVCCLATVSLLLAFLHHQWLAQQLERGGSPYPDFFDSSPDQTLSS